MQQSAHQYALNLKKSNPYRPFAVHKAFHNQKGLVYMHCSVIHNVKWRASALAKTFNN